MIAIPRKRTTKELDVATLASVRDALAREESVLSIASRLGLDRRTVTQLRDGLHVADRLGDRHQRCDGCGHKVELPCQICRARTYQQQTGPKRITGAAPCVS